MKAQTTTSIAACAPTPNKAMGPADEIARYKRVFGVGAQAAMEVVV